MLQLNIFFFSWIAGLYAGSPLEAGGILCWGVYDFISFFFNFLQKLFCKFLKKKDSFSYTNVF
jgi:hypothetical protein